MSNQQIKSKLKEAYKKFFRKMKIDGQTGKLLSKTNLKFPTYPYIGSDYGKCKNILIVGTDIGKDENVNGIQTFKERNASIEGKDLAEHNPHIAGTYFTALYFLKEHFVEWGDFWKKIKYAKTCQSILKAGKNMPQENPLSYIALTNFYKFVTEKREKRSGGGNRRHCDQQIELELFFEEVEIFKPKIVIFQSLSFNNKKWLERLSSDERLIYVGPHPSYRRSTQPDFFCKQMKLHT